jgi:hypothetical protein
VGESFLRGHESEGENFVSRLESVGEVEKRGH